MNSLKTLLKDKSVLCSICARGGSKGITDKNTRLLEGKPLIAHSIEQANSTGLFEHIVISSDSTAIIDIAIKYGAEHFFDRPTEMADDKAAKVPVIRHALQMSEVHYRQKFDIIVDLDATAPLRDSTDIIESLKQFLANDNENLITAMPSRRSPYFNLVELTEEGKVELSKPPSAALVRRQDSVQCFDMNASIYIWKRDCLLKNDSVFLDTTGLYIMPEERSIDIDSELDFQFVEFIMKRNRLMKS